MPSFFPKEAMRQVSYELLRFPELLESCANSWSLLEMWHYLRTVWLYCCALGRQWARRLLGFVSGSVVIAVLRAVRCLVDHCVSQREWYNITKEGGPVVTWCFCTS